MTDRQAYLERKAEFERCLTIYGRKPVLEALQSEELDCRRLHLADSNRTDGIIRDILRCAQQRDIDVRYHDRKALSRISRNGKQDQGVALDVELPAYRPLEKCPRPARFIALDGVTNPQNVGMIIRSVGASPIDGLILPRKGCAALGPLVIKASAGSLFKTPIYHCDSIGSGLDWLRQEGFKVYGLDLKGRHNLLDMQTPDKAVFVLGNESEGLSEQSRSRIDESLLIPMNRDVESLNVAVTAALIAFMMG